MVIIKSFTSLEQSKKLAKILPIESADMYYCYGMDIKTKEWSYDNTPTIIDEENKLDIGDITCWSLAALINVLPIGYVVVKNYQGFYYVESRDHERSTKVFNNPVDACVEMIIKLHEQNLL